MATAKPLLQRFTLWLWATVKAQPLATAMLFPLALLAVQVHLQREDAQTLRANTVEDNRLAQFQTSGKELDEALGNYLGAVSNLGLAERELIVPGAFTPTPVSEAQKELLAARKDAQKAIGKHAGDIKSLRGLVNGSLSDSYVEDLAAMTDIVDSQHDVLDIGSYTTTLGKLVKARDKLVDSYKV